MIELDPLCLKPGMKQLAMTNRGQLMPCCHLESEYNLHDPRMIKLLDASSVYDHSVEEILLSDEWIEFEDNLRNNIGPVACYLTCPKTSCERNATVIEETIEVSGKKNTWKV